MTDTTLLYLGACCFGLMLLGLVLTMREFATITRSRKNVARPTTAGARPPATRHPVQPRGL